MAKESGRLELYSLLRRDLGDDTAAALMAALPPPTDWDDLARRSDIGSLRGRMTSFEDRMTSFEGRMTNVESQLGEVRGGLLDLREVMIGMQGAIEAQVPKFLRANILTAFAAAGVVLAAVKL